MSPKGIFIKLDNPLQAYFSGQIISGRVVLVLDESTDFKTISLTFEGNASVEIEETRTRHVGYGNDSRTETYTVYYRSHENYFSQGIVFIGNENGGASLPAGNYEYPFQFPLPPNIPSSFDGAYGGVYYSMEARMRRGFLKFDMKATLPFAVIGALDLNFEPGIGLPAFFQEEKNVCCCCCTSGPVGFKVELLRSGFIPGEFINLHGEFMNFSKNRVKTVSVDLVKSVIYRAEGHCRSTTDYLASANSAPIEAGETREEAFSIPIPPSVQPSRLGNCSIIDVQYELELKMEISGLTKNLTVDIPIVIGTIPLRPISEAQSYNSIAPIPVQWQ